MRASDHARNHFADVSKMVGGTGSPDHFVDVNKMVGPHLCPIGAKLGSPGHHPRNGHPTYFQSPNGAKPIARHVWVTPRWGLEYSFTALPQGGALGYRVDAPLARKIPRTKDAKPDTIPRTKGAKPHSLGQRPRFNAPPFSPSPERAKPNTEACQ